jgi:hypothetical protein
MTGWGFGGAAGDPFCCGAVGLWGCGVWRSVCLERWRDHIRMRRRGGSRKEGRENWIIQIDDVRAHQMTRELRGRTVGSWGSSSGVGMDDEGKLLAL